MRDEGKPELPREWQSGDYIELPLGEPCGKIGFF